MKLRILLALLKKEVLLMRRNPLIPKMIVAMPLMVMLVIPLVANLDVKNVNVVVVDNDRSQLSRRIISDLGSTETVRVRGVSSTFKEAFGEVEQGDVDVVLTLPFGFEASLAGRMLPVEIEANGVNANKGMLGAQYVAQSVGGTLRGWFEAMGHPLPEDDTSILNLYNPTLNFRNYMIPALMVVLLIVICGFIPALNLVSEKESGTIEAINVTPVGKFTFVLSKLIPFWVVGIMVVAIGMTVGWAVYGLVPAGSIWAIFFASVLFSLVMSGLGLLIANKSSTMLESIFGMFAFIMVFQLMSGLFTPVSSMPGWAQTITYGIPPRYYIEIMRAVYLKGTPVAELWSQFLALGLFAVGFSILAAATYRKQS